MRYEPDDALALLSSRDGGGYLGDERAAARTPFPSRSRGTARWGTARGRCVDCLEPQIVVPEEFFVDMCVVAGGSDDGVDGSAASDGSNGGGEGSASHGAFRVIAATSEGRFFLFIIDPRCASDEDVVVFAPLDSLSAHFGGLRAVAAHIGEDPNEDEDDLDAAAVAAAGEGGGWFRCELNWIYMCVYVWTHLTHCVCLFFPPISLVFQLAYAVEAESTAGFAHVYPGRRSNALPDRSTSRRNSHRRVRPAAPCYWRS